jgi:nitrite reductase/ring-hydroxylating ferredoxin subunit
MKPLCAASSVAVGLPVLARLSPTTSAILLRLTDGSLVAWHNACPHMGIELDWEPRRLLSRNGRYLQCTGHGALFELDTGRCVRGPCVGEALTELPVRIENDMVVTEQSLL